MGRIRESMLLTFLIALVVDRTSGLITMNTTNDYNYQLAPFRVTGMTYIMFEVQACNDAHILLMADKDDEDTSVLEVVIAPHRGNCNGKTELVDKRGWANTRSVIRTYKQQMPPVADENPHNPPPLDCNSIRRFWISWEPSSSIRVGTGDYSSSFAGEFLVYEGSNVPLINYFRISTGWSATGHWILGTECNIWGDPHTDTLDDKRYTYSGKCWYDAMKHDEDFFIQTDYDGCMRKRSCLEATRIVYDNNDIQLKRRNIITVNNVNIALPPTFDDGDFTIEPITVPAPFTVRVELPIAANILWNGRRSLEIQLGLAYFNKTLGLCGTYTYFKPDDFTLRDLSVTTNKNIFGNDWRVEDCRCGFGWFWFNDYCYTLVEEPLTWDDAQNKCGGYDGFLARVPDNETDEFLKTTLLNGKNYGYWLGATNRSSNGTFVWEGPTPNPEFNGFGWLSGGPNGGTSEHCVHYLRPSTDFGWNDASCEIPLHCICQRLD